MANDNRIASSGSRAGDGPAPDCTLTTERRRGWARTDTIGYTLAVIALLLMVGAVCVNPPVDIPLHVWLLAGVVVCIAVLAGILMLGWPALSRQVNARELPNRDAANLFDNLGKQITNPKPPKVPPPPNRAHAEPPVEVTVLGSPSAQTRESDEREPPDLPAMLRYQGDGWDELRQGLYLNAIANVQQAILGGGHEEAIAAYIAKLKCEYGWAEPDNDARQGASL